MNMQPSSLSPDSHGIVSEMIVSCVLKPLRIEEFFNSCWRASISAHMAFVDSMPWLS